MEVLKGLNPERVFYYFENICKIPHGSGNTKAISDFCVDFAVKNNLLFYQDELNNVIIKKSASNGYEKKEPVIIQGHLDMVCEKEKDIEFNFLTDSLKLKVDGDLISATGTTLGADDGIAVAMALAILEDKNLKHPPLEVLFTVDEETGMFGAEGIDASKLEGKLLINVDSGCENVITVSCAGGARADLILPLAKEKAVGTVKKITISGLMGGHSGVEINKGRHNANVLMGKLLNKIGKFNLIGIEGGKKDNVIPSFCTAVIATKVNIEDIVNGFVSENYKETDSNLKIDTETLNSADFEYCYTAETSKKAAELITALPNGIIAMSREIEGLVETSLNLGVAEISKESIRLSFAVRSSVNNEKLKLLETLKTIATKFGAEFNDRSHYSAWEYKKDSRLRETSIKTFTEMFGREPAVEAIHAGLECGLFSEKIKGLDAVSIGPDMYDIHSTEERLSVSSVERCYNFILKILENL